MIADAVYSHLSSNVAFAAAARGGLYLSGTAPDDTPYPMATYSVDADEVDRLIDGDLSSLRISFVAIDCYSLVMREAYALADIVEAAMLPVHGDMGSLSPPQEVDDVRVSRDRLTRFEGDTKLFNVSLQFAVAYYP